MPSVPHAVRPPTSHRRGDINRRSTSSVYSLNSRRIGNRSRLSNRGVLCEFIVAQALGLASNGHDPWGTHDLVSATGTRIEVKSTAYLQSWDQTELSRPSWQNLTSRRVEPAVDGANALSLSPVATQRHRLPQFRLNFSGK
jgi:hypothetical protein